MRLSDFISTFPDPRVSRWGGLPVASLLNLYEVFGESSLTIFDSLSVFSKPTHGGRRKDDSALQVPAI